MIAAIDDYVEDWSENAATLSQVGKNGRGLEQSKPFCIVSNKTTRYNNKGAVINNEREKLRLGSIVNPQSLFTVYPIDLQDYKAKLRINKRPYNNG
jgi:hypothetical protein